jgi:hypothetical protein
MIRKFVVITLAVVIISLLLKNTDPVKQIIKTVTDLFGESFRAVTNVGGFK